MTRTVFPYPGGKTKLAPWIISQFPMHRCYVEVFGGGASILLNKPRSPNEVLNDKDGDVTQFFEVLRDRSGELVEWLRTVPYSKDLHEKWSGAFYAGYRPDDPIERAGRFFYLRYSQFSAKYRTKSGFTTSAPQNQAQRFSNAREDLLEFADRFDGVQIENRDYTVMLDRFDHPETLFYCDPPYMEEGDALYSHETAFDHADFVDLLEGSNGQWIVSYRDVPDALKDNHIVERDAGQWMNRGRDSRTEHATERLVMNFDPEATAPFVGAEQMTLAGVGGDD